MSVVGLDLSSGLLREAAGITGASLVQADMRQMPFPEARFAGVWACASLVHLDAESFHEALEEFYRVTCHDGALFLSTRAGRGREWRRVGDTHRLYHLYDQDSVAGMIELAGFSVLSIGTEPGVVAGSWVNAIARKS
ncbi:ubiquinone/menaquinone biosynthesis C-methylase UbiE [Nocardioides sp. HB32]